MGCWSQPRVRFESKKKTRLPLKKIAGIQLVSKERTRASSAKDDAWITLRDLVDRSHWRRCCKGLAYNAVLQKDSPALNTAFLANVFWWCMPAPVCPTLLTVVHTAWSNQCLACQAYFKSFTSTPPARHTALLANGPLSYNQHSCPRHCKHWCTQHFQTNVGHPCIPQVLQKDFPRHTSSPSQGLLLSCTQHF